MEKSCVLLGRAVRHAERAGLAEGLARAHEDAALGEAGDDLVLDVRARQVEPREVRLRLGGLDPQLAQAGVDLDALIRTSEWLEGMLGRRLEGQVYRAGPAPSE